MVNAPARFREIGDFAKALRREWGVGVTAALALGERDPASKRDADSQVENSHGRPALSEQEPDTELFLGQMTKENRQQDEPEQNRQPAAEPAGGSAKRNAAGHGHLLKS